jgi:hypothetical protein
LYLMPGVKMYRQIACQRESTWVFDSF